MHEPGFRHEVMFYAGAEEFLQGTLPFLRGALEAGEPALVAVREANTRMLRAELGGEAGDVAFVAMEELGRNPARIIPFWRDFVDRHGGGRPVRGIGEPIWPGRSEPEIDECQRHESLLNVAFGGAPAWRLLCPYDSRSLPDHILEAARDCHPFLGEGAECAANPACDSRSGGGPFDGALAARPETARRFAFDRSVLHEVRELVARESERHGLTAIRRTDLVTAASELAANSILHGGGRGELAIWGQDGTLLVEVQDTGSIAEPLSGRIRPDLEQLGGRGLWLANALCDLVQIRSGGGRTTVRLHMAVDDRARRD
jgi:anti-sigma regulatory factor (Ser/Thr protein kinase)